MRPSCQSTRENKKKDNKTKTSSLLLLLLWINGCCYLFPPPPSASVSLLSVCLISPLWSCRAQLCPLQVEMTRRRGRRPQIWARRGEGMFLWWINVFIYGTCWGLVVKEKNKQKLAVVETKIRRMYFIDSDCVGATQSSWGFSSLHNNRSPFLSFFPAQTNTETL